MISDHDSSTSVSNTPEHRKVRVDPQQLKYVPQRGGEVRWYTYVYFTPIWLLFLTTYRFLPRSHPWRNRPADLRTWVHYGTKLALLMSLVLGLSTVGLFFCWGIQLMVYLFP